ncbi:aspartate dehydrogenase [Lacrimispora saccharolytica]|uniref:aspartate dehydrogenase n=1 Tax=Lacrimispora saccharolytica TaxID=84030 RepID=UPI00265CD39F|nr:aspartate dehydrogenase [Lacrimispora saccharolytica]MCF2656939.1 aspartate dehydrogenase [Lacrimispora saccharolytica]
MGIFIKKKTSIPLVEYNPEKERPVLKCSICNGEQIAGFKDKQTGHFTEVILIRNGQDLDEFMEMYDLSSVTKEY